MEEEEREKRTGVRECAPDTFGIDFLVLLLLAVRVFVTKNNEKESKIEST